MMEGKWIGDEKNEKKKRRAFVSFWNDGVRLSDGGKGKVVQMGRLRINEGRVEAMVSYVREKTWRKLSCLRSATTMADSGTAVWSKVTEKKKMNPLYKKRGRMESAWGANSKGRVWIV